MKKIFSVLMLMMAFVSFNNINHADAQSWTVGPQTPSWAIGNATGNPPIGDGVQRGSEVYVTAQGGTPPAMAYEPSNIGGGSNYTYSTWLGVVPDGTCIETDPADPHYGENTKCRPDHGEAKFRILCPFSHRSRADPIVAHGVANGPHLHDFFGNFSTDENSTYASLRNNPKSNCAGGPLAASGYWEPTMLMEISPGVYVPVNPNWSVFYYTTDYSDVSKLVRIPNGMAFIGGVNPADRLAATRLAELPAGINKYDATTNPLGPRYNGWIGITCAVRSGAPGGTPAPVLQSNTTADPQYPGYTSGYVRQLQNLDGSDPWGGTCDGPNYELVFVMDAPQCWDGYNLTSPNGREHFRYKVARTDNLGGGMCPDGWWQVVSFQVKTSFPAMTAADRAKWFLSSDRMDPNPANWQPRGSTFHFDWMMGWDRTAMNSWNQNCNGMTINGITVSNGARTCQTDVIADNTFLLAGTSPDLTMAPNGFGNALELGPLALKYQVGHIITGNGITDGLSGGNKVNAVIVH